MIAPTCQQYITTAETHVKALLLPHNDPALTLRILCCASVSACIRQVWDDAAQGNAEATLQSSRTWYKAVREALRRELAEKESSHVPA
jgi:hypothetical protein